MTCGIKKADHGTPVDLISDLPGNVIDCIFGHLPIQDAVKTSILSRKWRYMWTMIPRLKFDENFFQSVLNNGHFHMSEIPSVITEVLLLHHGPLCQFILIIHEDYPIRIRCLTQWILFLSRRGIKYLELVNEQEEPYEMPSHLFSCMHLTELRLANFTLTILPDFIGLKTLIELQMCDIKIESAALESLISSCPLLKLLSIRYGLGFDYLNISAPCLQVLVIKDVPVKSICFEKSKNLVHLTIKRAENLKIERTRAVEDSGRGRRSNLVNFFSSLPKIEELCLAHGYIKFLSADCIPLTLPNMIYSLQYLKLVGIDFSQPGEISLLVCLLKSFPNLVELELKIHAVEGQLVLNSFEELACNNCTLGQLRTVTVTVEVNTVLASNIVEYLLANSPLLEDLTFLISRDTGAQRLLKVSRNLSQLQPESPRAEFHFRPPFYYCYEL